MKASSDREKMATYNYGNTNSYLNIETMSVEEAINKYPENILEILKAVEPKEKVVLYANEAFLEEIRQAILKSI